VGPDPGRGDEGLLDARRGAGFIARALEALAEHVERFVLIVHHEDTAAARHGTRHQMAVGRRRRSRGRSRGPGPAGPADLAATRRHITRAGAERSASGIGPRSNSLPSVNGPESPRLDGSPVYLLREERVTGGSRGREAVSPLLLPALQAPAIAVLRPEAQVTPIFSTLPRIDRSSTGTMRL
jgi:hypothetical protein